MMMETVNTSETLVKFYHTTRSKIPEDSVFIENAVEVISYGKVWEDQVDVARVCGVSAQRRIVNVQGEE
jgi:hypothetical protein